MAKMYYTEDEAAAQLKTTTADLDKMVHDQKLRVYRDGAKKMYKVTEVDALATPAAGEIELAPGDTGDALRLTETDAPARPAGKEDTVISAEGISIFDDEDLEIEAADPMAKTQIAPAVEDQVAIEGVGSGSGLLDLTRESDDTSLGAEVLDNIDVEGAGSGLIQDEAPAPAYAPAAEIAAGPQTVEASDPMAGLFGGIAVAGAAVALLMLMVTVASVFGRVPGFMESLAGNATAVFAGSLVVVLIGAGAGFYVGKSAAQRQAALRKVA